MKILRVVSAALLFGAAGSVSADDAQQLLAFAKANAGRFGTEVALPAPMRLRVEADSSFLVMARYLPLKQKLVQDFPSNVDQLTVSRACKTEGSYVGKTALGASRQVTKRSCTQLDLEDPSGGVVLGELGCDSTDEGVGQGAAESTDCLFLSARMEASLTPDQYRDVKRRGIWLDLTFEPGNGAEQEVATRTNLVGTPKLDWPYDERIAKWTVYGRVTEVKLLLKDGTTHLGTYVGRERSKANPRR